MPDDIRVRVADLQLVLIRSLVDRAALAAREQTDVGLMTALLLADVAVETLMKAALTNVSADFKEKGDAADLRAALEKHFPAVAKSKELAAVAKLRPRWTPKTGQ